MYKRLVIAAILLALLVSGCAGSAGVATQNYYTVALANLFVAQVPSGISSFTLTEAGLGGVQLFQPVAGSLTVVAPATVVAAIGVQMSYGGVVQQLAEGNIRFQMDGVEYSVNRTTGEYSVKIVDPERAEAAARQISLETDTPLTKQIAEGEDAQAKQPTLSSKRQQKDPVTVVVADDDPADLAQMAVAAKAVMFAMGYSNVTVVQCLNNFECIKNTALSGGPDGSRCIVLFLDGGFVGMPVPPGAPFPPVPAKTVAGKHFFSGPWIATFLMQMGYMGAVIYVSTEGWDTIKQFKNQGAELGPTLTKEFFFWRPESFAGRILEFIPK